MMEETEFGVIHLQIMECQRSLATTKNYKEVRKGASLEP